MKEADLYWVIYKNLEAETISLAKQVAFTDDQKGVYSMIIADLIVRCAIEIESLSKKLYESLGGNMHPTDSAGNERDLYFDTDCLNMLEKKYILSRKEVILSSPFFSFDDSVIFPLKKAYRRGNSGSMWERAYQALKHNRYASLKEYGNVWNLINAMGALYLLNLYYKDVVYPLENRADSFDARVDSDIFSIVVFDASKVNISSDSDDIHISNKNMDDLDRATYIVKKTNEHLFALQQAIKKDTDDMNERIMSERLPIILQELSNRKEVVEYAELEQLAKKVFNPANLSEYVTLSNFAKEFKREKREAVLNKHHDIYAKSQTTPAGDLHI